MSLTDEEKIQKAEEIYYRRNGINYRGEKKEKNRKNHPIRKLFIIGLIIICAYGYKNKEYLMSEEFQIQTKKFLNTKIDIQKIFGVENSSNKEENILIPQEKIEENNIVAETPEKREENNIINEVIWPYTGIITSDFGQRESTDTRVTSNHTGIDIAGNEGDKIISAINGNVVIVSEEGDLRKTLKN